jgi:hypothetical protein
MDMRIVFLKASAVIYAMALFALGALRPVGVGKHGSGGAAAWFGNHRPAATSRRNVLEWCAGLLLLAALALSGFAWPYL